jgi:hypothetical protein
MKIKYLFFMLFFCILSNAQNKIGIYGDKNWTENWTNFKPQIADYNESTQILTGNIAVNTILTKKNVYLLMGTVRVIKKAILTIEPGTVIRGDLKSTGALMICKGSKIIAKGTVTDPIVFTSNKSNSERKAGDWGGLIILGDAPLNTQTNVAFSQFDMNSTFNSYGGKNDLDTSGILKYVRVEFAGRKDATGYSSNGISLGGIGNKTIFENIQVSNSFDDSFQIYGGNVIMNNIVSFNAKDDDFDITQGCQFTLKNSLILRNPFISDVLHSRCFEIDNAIKNDVYLPEKKKTFAKISNATLVNMEKENVNGLVKEAIFLNDDTLLDISKSVISGFSSFVSLDKDFFVKDNFKKIIAKDVLIDKVPVLFVKKETEYDNYKEEKLADIKDWFLLPINNIKQSNLGPKALFKNGDFKNNPDFRLK